MLEMRIYPGEKQEEEGQGEPWCTGAAWDTSIDHYIISKSDILKTNCSSIALLDKYGSQDTTVGHFEGWGGG